ncbi:MAG: phytoene desaturase family protein [Promethearchaeota archaeon]
MMDEIKDEYKFIVIGGGITGLQIAALCSRMGSTLLIERNAYIGGRARVINKDGFILDFGPHPIRFGPKSAIFKTFKEATGKKLKLIKPGLTYCYLADGSKKIFPSGAKGFLKSKLFSLKDFLKAIKIMRKLNKESQEKFLKTSLKEFFDKYEIDKDVQKFFLMASASMMVNPYPERSSLGEIYYSFLEVIKKGSVFYPDGGWNTIISNLEQSIMDRENGSQILLNTRVNKIIIKDNKAIGVEIEPANSEGSEENKIQSARKVLGDYIISSVHASELDKIIDPNDRDENTETFIKRCKEIRPTAGVCIDFCLRSRITDETLMFFEDPPSFGFVPSNLSDKVVPAPKDNEDYQIMSFFAPVDRSVIKDKEERTKFFNKFKDTILRTYPEINNHLIWERDMFLEMVDGIEIATDQNRITRVKPDDLKIANLFLTGDSLGGHGAGGDIGHNSVRECYGKIIEQINASKK